MGDGIQKKYALILNGDGETRHLGNVDRAIKALRAEGSFDISVASPKQPASAADHFEAPDREGLAKLLDGMKSQMDDDDLLVVYFTGHGEAGTAGEGCVSLPKECLSLGSLAGDLKKLSFGKRILVMDNCYSGSGFNYFADSKTTVVSQGSPGEKVSCQLFSPFFWSDQVPDEDGDGKISVQERFQYAVLKGQSESLLQFYSPEPIAFSGPVGARPFKTSDGKPVEVSNGKELKAQLARLKPGQVALVAFSADWCVPCKTYQPHFEALAKQDGGRVLMIHAEGKDGSEEDWASLGINSFPTVAFIDWNGKIVKVADPKDPMASLALAAVHSPEEQAKIFIRKLASSDPQERHRATQGLRAMEAKAAPAVPALAKALSDTNEAVRHGAVLALAEIGPQAAAAVPELRKLLSAQDYELVLAAVRALAKIGPKASPAIPDLFQLFRGDLEALAKKSVENNGFSAALNQSMVFDKVFNLTGALAAALVRIDPKHPDLLKTFLEIAKDPKQGYIRRRQSISGLEWMASDAAEAAPQLISLFSDKEIGPNCQTAIAHIAKSSPSTVELLVTKAGDKKIDPFRRYLLLEVLSLVGPAAHPQAEAIWRLAVDPSEDPRIRKQAAVTLRKIAPDQTDKTDPILKELEGVAIRFDGTPEKSEAPPPAPTRKAQWFLSPDLEFSVRQGSGGAGVGIWAGRRIYGNFELRLGTSFQAMHLPKERHASDFQATARIEPVFHLFGAPEKSGPYVTVGEAGVYHLFNNDITGAYLAPLGLGFSFKLGESSQLSLGMKGQVLREKEWKGGLAGNFGWVTAF